MPELGTGKIGGDGASTLADQPAGALRRAGTDLEHAAPCHVAEQARVGLVEPLGPPDEVAVTEERAVLSLVAVGLGVPPGPAGPGRITLRGRTGTFD